MDTLAAFFGRDEITFSVNSTITGTTHTFENFDDVVAEVDNARIFGGMHYRHSVKEGNRLGRRVAEHILKRHFRRGDYD